MFFHCRRFRLTIVFCPFNIRFLDLLAHHIYFMIRLCRVVKLLFVLCTFTVSQCGQTARCHQLWHVHGWTSGQRFGQSQWGEVTIPLQKVFSIKTEDFGKACNKKLFVCADICEWPSDPWSNIHQPEAVWCHSLWIRYPSSNQNEQNISGWFASGYLITFIFPAPLNPPWKTTCMQKCVQKSSFLVYRTDLLCRTVLYQLIRNYATSDLKESRWSLHFFLLLYRSSASLLFLTFCTFTYIHSGEKPTQSAWGSPQGKFGLFICFYSVFFFFTARIVSLACKSGTMGIFHSCIDYFCFLFSMRNTQVSCSWVTKRWNPRNAPIQMKDMLNQTKLNGRTSQVID